MTDPRPPARPASGYAPIGYGELESVLITVIIGIFYLISMYCLFKLWKKEIGIFKKLVWSIVLLIPFFGPIAYGALFKLPEPLPENEQMEYSYTRHGTPWH